MGSKVSRRSFLQGAGILGAAAIGAGLMGCSAPEAEGSKYVPDSWDAEADLVIVGSGGAGLSAGIAACQNGATALVLEVSPEAECGGNTRVSGNMIMVPEDVQQGVTYQTNLNGGYVVEPEIMKAWSEGLAENLPWLDELGYEMVFAKFASPEFPGVEGGDSIKTYYYDPTTGIKLWDALYESAQELGVEFRFDTRVTELVYDRETNEVFGVKTEAGAFKANKAVILACGGFENNPEMISDYFPNTGCSQVFFFGTPYNRGDGHKMVMDIGADLWHMNSFAAGGVGMRIYEGESAIASLPTFKTKEFIYVDGEGERFMYEEKADHNRHGKLKERGVWPLITVPDGSHVIIGQKLFDAGMLIDPSLFGIAWVNVHPEYLCGIDNQALMDAGILVKADTVEELAQKLGYNPETLAKTIRRYNENAVAGSDPDFHRGEAVVDDYFFDAGQSSVGYGEDQVSIPSFELAPIEGPFYALELSLGLLNSQGGPRKNANCQVLDTKGQVIPRLYAAGEFGAPYPYMYNGGGNVSDAIATGRVAGRHGVTLEPWGAN